MNPRFLLSSIAVSAGLLVSGCCQPQGLGVYEATLVPRIQGCGDGVALGVGRQVIDLEITSGADRECLAGVVLRSGVLVDDVVASPPDPRDSWFERVNKREVSIFAAADEEQSVVAEYVGEGARDVEVANAALAFPSASGSFDATYGAQVDGKRFALAIVAFSGFSQCTFVFDVELRRKS